MRWPTFYWISFEDWATCSGIGSWERIYLKRRKPKLIPAGSPLMGEVTVNTSTGEVFQTSMWTPFIRSGYNRRFDAMVRERSGG